MKIRLIVLIISFLIVGQLSAQTHESDSSKNFIYLEAGGIGGVGSINYERIFYNVKKLAFSARIGLGTYNIIDFTRKFNPDLFIPISLYGTWGNDHKIEVGIGETMSNVVHYSLTEHVPERSSEFHSNFTIGYRYQKKGGRFIFKCSYSPIIEKNKQYRHWGGISFGYILK